MLDNIRHMLSKAMNEWSVGDLSSKIDKNITDKVSLKSLRKGDIIVLAKTSIYDMAKSQDKGDIQVTITEISGTDVKGTAVNGDSIDLNLLDMRILEAYSMLDSDTKIFVVDLPTKINKTFESFELGNKSELIKTLGEYQKFFKSMGEKGMEIFDFSKFQDEYKQIKVKSDKLLEVIKVIPDEFVQETKMLLFYKNSIKRRLNEFDLNYNTDKKSGDTFFISTTCDGVSYDLELLSKRLKNSDV